MTVIMDWESGNWISRVYGMTVIMYWESSNWISRVYGQDEPTGRGHQIVNFTVKYRQRVVYVLNEGLMRCQLGWIVQGWGEISPKVC